MVRARYMKACDTVKLDDDAVSTREPSYLCKCIRNVYVISIHAAAEKCKYIIK